MHTACEWMVCVSRDGLLTCLGCIPASRFLISTLIFSSTRFPFSPSHSAGWFSEHSLRGICCCGGSRSSRESPVDVFDMKRANSTWFSSAAITEAEWETQYSRQATDSQEDSQTDVCAGFYICKVAIMWRWSLWNIFTSEESTSLQVNIQLKCPKLFIWKCNFPKKKS